MALISHPGSHPFYCVHSLWGVEAKDKVQHLKNAGEIQKQIILAVCFPKYLQTIQMEIKISINAKHSPWHVHRSQIAVLEEFGEGTEP